MRQIQKVKELLELALGHSGYNISQHRILNPALVTQNAEESVITFDLLVDKITVRRTAYINLKKLFTGESSIKVKTS